MTKLELIQEIIQAKMCQDYAWKRHREAAEAWSAALCRTGSLENALRELEMRERLIAEIEAGKANQ